jgi:hypothetical protein
VNLKQTPNSPVASGTSSGRKTKGRMILVCQGATQSAGSEVPTLSLSQTHIHTDYFFLPFLLVLGGFFWVLSEVS